MIAVKRACGRVLIAAGALWWPAFGCQTRPMTATPGVVAAPTAGAIPAGIVVEPWSFQGREGREIRTGSYRIFTTVRDRMISGRIGGFMEAALQEYRSLLAGDPPTPAGMEMFLLAERTQWAAMTVELMGSDAETYLRIQRGGFSAAGRAVLYDLGTHDTFAIAAHEGWHQYTQRSFRQPLPLWLEEGIAAYMEGFRWRADEPETPNFMAWANVERFDQLRYSAWRRGLQPLEALLNGSPQELIDTTTSGTLTYYAQVWALVHFLREGEGGKYRESFEALLSDAAAGRMLGRVQERLGSRGAREAVLRRRGTAVFRAYFNTDLEEASREYDAFLAVLTTRGARSRIVRGESPLSVGSPPRP